MAKILFRGNVSPIQPAAVASGSVAKGTPLTNDEGDWNYKALNDDIQTRAPIDAPSFTGVVSVNYNIRSVLAKYNKYVAGFAGSIASCKIGEYLPNANALNATLIVEVVGRTTNHLAHAKAMVMYRSETLPATLITITNDKYRNNTTDLTIEAYVDNTTGKLVLFANTTGTLTNVSFNVDVYERSADNLFTLNTGYVAKNTTGLTQIVESPSVPEDIQSLLDTKVSKSGDVMTGNLTAPNFIGALNGNASTATVLETPRTINGVSFDGSANITIADATKVPLNGTGATGTWNISVSGNAATATNATYSNSASAKWTSAAVNAASAASDGTCSVEVRNAGGTGDTGLAAMVFHCSSAYATKLHLRHDGFFGLGGYSRAAWTWYLDNGSNMVAAGNVTAYSDPRLKENFKRIDDPMAILNKLDGGTFNWRHGFPHIACKAGKRDYGILADQVQAVMPEIVTNSIDIDDEVYLTVAYDKLVPVLIEAVRQMDARIKELEGE